jgi:hypothetical protein
MHLAPHRHLKSDQAMLDKNAFIILSLLFLLTTGICAVPAGLGESLLLEGRVALQRGEAWVLNRQNNDGSWQNDPALTAQAGILLANSDSQHYSDSLRLARQWMQKNAQNITKLGDFVQALRLLLRLQSLELPEIIKKFQQKKATWDLSRESLINQQCLLETHFLAAPEQALLSSSEVQFLQGNFLREQGTCPSFALLTMLARGDHQKHRVALRDLSSACIKQAATAEAENLFWIVRALRVAERFLPTLDKSWRASIVASILEKQDGQGAFARSGKQGLPGDLASSVFYLQILQLCLDQAR